MKDKPKTFESIGEFSYASDTPPPKYQCGVCGVHGCKLWRDWNTFADHVVLRCAPCAFKTGENKGPVDVDGKVLIDRKWRSDQVNGLAPAVPTEDGETFWGYSSVPEPGVEWWKRLPSMPMRSDAQVTPSATSETEAGEPSFVLLGRDPIASFLVSLWVKVRSETVGVTSETSSAEATSTAMQRWAHEHGKSEQVDVAREAFVRVICLMVKEAVND